MVRFEVKSWGFFVFFLFLSRLLTQSSYPLFTGNNVTMYLVDGFSHQWVRTPGSIDLMIGAYEQLAGYNPDSKDQVLQNVQWRFTGRRSTQYKFQGAGSAAGSTSGSTANNKIDVSTASGLCDWEFCSQSSQCENNCCSNEYSNDGKYKVFLFLRFLY